MLDVIDLSFKYTDKLIINNLNMRLFRQDHAVLIGKNGAGKSTLMKLIAKELIPDSGNVSWLPNIKYGYLDQHQEIFNHLTLKDYLYETYSNLFDLEEKMNDYYLKASNLDNNYEKYLAWAQEIMEKLEREDFYNIKTKIDNVLFGLGLGNVSMDTKIEILSGGMKAKLFLAKLILEDCDCILLDEPTNFLDINHINWLINYLKNCKKAYLVISHDSHFIQNVGETVFELENGSVERYNGGYEAYLRESKVRKEQALRDYEAQQRFIKKTEDYIQKNIVRATTTKQAQSRRKMLEKLDILKKPVGEEFIKIDFKSCGRIGDDVLIVKELIIGYNKPLLKPISFEIYHNEKVAIIGKNGIGKSTLLKTLVNQINSLGGSFKFNEAAKILYLSQEDFLPSLKPIDYVRSFYPDYDNKKIRSLLARKKILADSMDKDCSVLSGGEKIKVRLAILEEQKGNLLILDEPTNHLDFNAKKELYRAINSFDGPVIFVSHDTEFIEAVADKIIDLES